MRKRIIRVTLVLFVVSILMYLPESNMPISATGVKALSLNPFAKKEKKSTKKRGARSAAGKRRARAREHIIQAQAGIGGGYSYFGRVRGTDFDNNGGLGYGFCGSFLYSYRIYAVECGALYSKFQDVPYDIQGTQYKADAAGSLFIFDPKIGVKLLQRPNRLGSLFLYGGARIWSASSKFTEIGGQNVYAPDDKYTGIGWLFGMRHLGTFSSFWKEWSYIYQWGLSVIGAPARTYESDGNEVNIKDPSGVSGAGELGLGIGKNRDRYAIMLTLKYDIILSQYKVKTDYASTSYAAGAGIGQIYLSIIKEFDAE